MFAGRLGRSDNIALTEGRLSRELKTGRLLCQKNICRPRSRSKRLPTTSAGKFAALALGGKARRSQRGRPAEASGPAPEGEPDYYERLPELNGRTGWRQLDTTLCTCASCWTRKRTPPGLWTCWAIRPTQRQPAAPATRCGWPNRPPTPPAGCWPHDGDPVHRRRGKRQASGKQLTTGDLSITG